MLYNIFICLIATLCFLPTPNFSADNPPTPSEALTPEKALAKLMEGNARYTADKLEHPNRSAERREALTASQNPFAAIIGCSDSRVSPEIVFDQGIGDLFVIRDAGNVVGPIEISSAEFAAKALNVSLILVLGHENCGAVKAVLAHQSSEIAPIAAKIEDSIKNFYVKGNNQLEDSIKANVRGVTAELKRNPLMAQLIKEKKLGVVGGYYNLATGRVDLCCDLKD